MNILQRKLILLTDESSRPQTAGLPSSGTPKSRRPSETMLPPAGASTKGYCSQGSTPKAITAPKVLPAGTTVFDQTSLTSKFSEFAQSIISASSINVKINNLNEVANQDEAECRRFQRHSAAYQTLMDHTKLRREASYKTKVRLSKQFETLMENQHSFASQLEAQLAQSSAPAKDERDGNDDMSRIKCEISDMRKELRETQITLEDQKRRFLKSLDSEKSHRKAVKHDDLDGYAKKEDFLLLEKKISAPKFNPEKLERKISDLAAVTGERHRDAQAALEHDSTRNQILDITISRLQAQRIDLDKRLDAQNDDALRLNTDVRRLQDSLANIKTVVEGNSENNESGLVVSVKNNDTTLTQIKHAMEQLTEVTQTLEEGIRENRQRRSQTLSEDQSVLTGDVQTLRQDLETLAEDQSKEYTLLVEGINNLESSMKQCQSQLSRLNEASKEKAIEKFSKTPHADGALNTDGFLPVKIEKIETDLKALDTQLVVQKRQFDNLTTEHLAQCIIHQTKQLYKEHPGHVHDKLRDLERWQNWTDMYLMQNLGPRLQRIDEAIKGCATRDTVQALQDQNQRFFESNVDTKKETSDHIDGMRSSLNRQGDTLAKMQDDTTANIETTSERLNALQMEVENLKRGVYAEAAIHPAPQPGSQVAATLKEGNVVRVEDEAGIASESRRSNSRATTSSRNTDRNGTENGSGGSTPLFDDAIHMQKPKARRKRKSFFSVSDSEDDDGKGTARKLPKMGS